MHIELIDEVMTRKLGKAIREMLPTISFSCHADWKLGKSHFARAFEEARVTDASPTYGLSETYPINQKLTVSYMDLYRLEGPQELELIGFRDMLDDRVC